MSDQLVHLRAEIDAVDRELMKALGRRFALCREAAMIKHAAELPLHQPDRENEVRGEYRRLAGQHGFGAEFAAAFYDLMLAEAYRLEERTLRAIKESAV
ncbi:MAG: chorismate mutase [Dehalococcoidia bacterium]|nr:chorismate mutase [Dehalococcoidia bacterium]